MHTLGRSWDAAAVGNQRRLRHPCVLCCCGLHLLLLLLLRLLLLLKLLLYVCQSRGLRCRRLEVLVCGGVQVCRTGTSRPAVAK